MKYQKALQDSQEMTKVMQSYKQNSIQSSQNSFMYGQLPYQSRNFYQNGQSIASYNSSVAFNQNLHQFVQAHNQGQQPLPPSQFSYSKAIHTSNKLQLPNQMVINQFQHSQTKLTNKYIGDNSLQIGSVNGTTFN